MMIALTAAKSPGVTTAAIALTLTWPRPCLLLEADPAGSDLHTGLLRSRGRLDRGLLAAALAVRSRPDPAAVLAQATTLDHEVGERLLITGLTDPAQAPALEPAWSDLASALRALPRAGIPHDVLIDAGRLGHRYQPTPLLAACDAVLLLVRPHVTHLHHTLAHIPALRPPSAAAPRLLLASVGDSRHLPEGRLRDLAAERGAVYLGQIPEDARAAQILGGAGELGRGIERTALLRGARALALSMHSAASPPPGTTPPRPVPAAPSGAPAPGGEYVAR